MIIKTKELMKNHTTFKVGGKVDVYCIPENKNELVELIKFLKKNNYPTYIIANGSNVLVSDNDLHGCVVEINRKYFGKIDIKDNIISADAGALLSEICDKACKAGLSGMENLSGIPGTIGGAAFMNAGAFEKEMKDIVKEVRVITKDGIEKVFQNSECNFSYRNSVFQNGDYIITNVKIKLNEGDISEIKKTMKHYNEMRRSKQPLDKPSAGSFFKRPINGYAGQLIDESNLKGTRIGDAQISTKHCGFIVNEGKATAKEIIELMKIIQNKVFTYHGVNLEPEVKMWGKF